MVLDPHRQGHERLYHPGEVNFLRGQVLIINKADTASKDAIDMLLASVAEFNPRAVVLQTASRISVEGGRKSRGRGSWSLKMARRLLMGEWPTVRAHLAARQYGAAELVDPRPFAVGTLKIVFENYPHLTQVLPAEGYFPEQLKDLEATIQRTPCDLVLVATPIDLTRLVTISQPVLRVTYRVEDWGEPRLEQVIEDFIRLRIKAG